jgi:regulator of RNase E activity RraA
MAPSPFGAATQPGASPPGAAQPGAAPPDAPRLTPAELLADLAADLTRPGQLLVVQDLDAPRVIGSFWGEVNANVHRALGCVVTITDGAIRDLDEMTNAGFKALARRLCVGHAHVTPVRWGVPVTVFGREVRPGQLIHADKHGFLVVPPEDEDRLLEAAAFMDANECHTVIAAARSAAGLTRAEALARLTDAAGRVAGAARERFSRAGAG